MSGRWLLVCECGVIANGYAGARCNRDRRANVRQGCPVRWEWWVFTGETETIERSA